MTPQEARSYLADNGNFWPNDELCYLCGDGHDSLATEYLGKIFCTEKCCNRYMKIVKESRTK